MSSIYFATCRNPIFKDGVIIDFGPDFSERGRQDLRFGVAEVEGGKMIGLAVMPEDTDTPASREVFQRVKTKMATQGRDTLVNIHGYATSFRQAIEGAAKTKAAYAAANLNVVVFSWPSDGAKMPWDYGDDRHDARTSGLPFARAFLKLGDFLATGEACGQRVHLLCHSMGNYVLRNALRSIVELAQGAKLPRLFDNIFSMAADEDADAFDPEPGHAGMKEPKWERLTEICRAVHVYINAYDRALQISDATKGNPDRMGNTGPAKPRTLPAKVSVVDVSATDRAFADLVGHGYYDEKPQVIADVLAVLAGAEPEAIPNRTYIPAKNVYKLHV